MKPFRAGAIVLSRELSREWLAERRTATRANSPPASVRL
jgi:hypothetical protein